MIGVVGVEVFSDVSLSFVTRFVFVFYFSAVVNKIEDILDVLCCSSEIWVVQSLLVMFCRTIWN